MALQGGGGETLEDELPLTTAEKASEDPVQMNVKPTDSTDKASSTKSQMVASINPMKIAREVTTANSGTSESSPQTVAKEESTSMLAEEHTSNCVSALYRVQDDIVDDINLLPPITHALERPPIATSTVTEGEKYVVVDEKDVAADMKNVVVDEKDVAADMKNVVVNEKDVAADMKKVVVDEKDVVVDEKDVAADMKNVVVDEKDVAAEVWKTVEQYYKKHFVGKWKQFPALKDESKNKESKTIRVFAALVVKAPCMSGGSFFEVVTMTQGTKHRSKTCICGSSNSTHYSTDGDCWTNCDGHAEAACFQFANEFFLDQLYNHSKKGKPSYIFEKCNNGFKLKSGVSFILFVSHTPCGFMTHSEYPYMSWKEFQGKPHCPECSSKILINSFLGIQGYLTHLLVEPIYIKYIVLPEHLKKEFASLDSIDKTLDSFTAEKIGIYSFQWPIVIFTEAKVSALDSFTPYVQDKPLLQQDQGRRSVPDGALQKHTNSGEKTGNSSSKGSGTPQSAGLCPDTSSEKDLMVYSVINHESRLTDHKKKEQKDRVIYVTKTLKLDIDTLKERLKDFESAHKRLHLEFLNIKSALTKQKEFCFSKLHIKEWNKKFDDIKKKIKEKENTKLLNELAIDVEKSLKSVQKSVTDNLRYETMYDFLNGLNINELNEDEQLIMMDCDMFSYINMIKEIIDEML